MISYKKDESVSLIEQIEKDDSLRRIVSICRESINRCFERLPMKGIPDIYLWIGNYTSPAECSVINGKPAIIISLEFFTDIETEAAKYHAYFKSRCNGIENSIPIIIANQYCSLILHRTGILGKAFLYKLYEMGLAAYSSKEIFPEIPLSSHLFITSAELEWCRRNEWFLKREIKPYLQSKDDNIINRFFSVSENNNGKWFPDRTGCFTGYRIIEEYLKKAYTLTVRDLITESPVEVVARSRFFNISN